MSKFIPSIGCEVMQQQGRLRKSSGLSNLTPGEVMDRYGNFSKAAYHEYLHQMITAADERGDKNVKMLEYRDFLVMLKDKVTEIKQRTNKGHTGERGNYSTNGRSLWSD